LGDAVAVVDAIEAGGPEGVHGDEKLPAVVGVDGAVDDRHAPAAKAGARADLHVIAARRLDGDAGGNEGDVRTEIERAFAGDAGKQVEAGGAGGCPKRQAGAGAEKLHLEHRGHGRKRRRRTDVGQGAAGAQPWLPSRGGEPGGGTADSSSERRREQRAA
jgi:hypothetical protein